MRGWLATILILIGMSFPAFAVQPDEVLADKELEARARTISAELRCLVCQNQSIDDSDADLAKDLRIIVRERLTAGDDDEEVMNYVVARYGEFVLLKPRFTLRTALLWGAPLLILLVGATVLFMNRRQQTTDASAELSSDERKRLDAILKDG
ncbi:cytochrome c-type biogenesis protein CcmH [Tianweitania sp. BSSL-BM11]|uniref:Cytochrome c-type biogenesis protein n=1 Tax=Tianweitania aestuarii TaxID=2814886 RepID=A0ABS5RS75_9HYPH|nr:cytochrome c-type biogenesis protein [Tianweitania aestuarii]MBS9719905.1 cytochrome c-type biogenesis protein CcmH [Tianweitania aestuarii]